jgi:hypothetical protein
VKNVAFPVKKPGFPLNESDFSGEVARVLKPVFGL